MFLCAFGSVIFIDFGFEEAFKKSFFTSLLPSISTMAMANIGSTTVQRPTAAPPPLAASTPIIGSKHYSSRRNRNNSKSTFPFDIPSSPEAAAARIIRNLTFFGPYYLIFAWSILAIPLLPHRKVSLMILMAMTVVTCLFLLLLRSHPMVIEKILVLALIAIVTMVAMILTKAAIHFFASLAGSVPVILIHAVLRTRDDLVVDDEDSAAAGELVPLVNQTVGETEPAALV
ncbi:PRA1 family protein F4-like [Diospyros lotus]|uniref:PRA1 family protein F4-like n=1 Tax=Diospyros lotus TaxID=55363 RepID=UPI00225089A3|nr:PRA1 family protein F4-like [Diospyros lotus]